MARPAPGKSSPPGRKHAHTGRTYKQAARAITRVAAKKVPGQNIKGAYKKSAGQGGYDNASGKAFSRQLAGALLAASGTSIPSQQKARKGGPLKYPKPKAAKRTKPRYSTSKDTMISNPIES